MGQKEISEKQLIVFFILHGMNMYKVYRLTADEIFLKSINDYNDDEKKRKTRNRM